MNQMLYKNMIQRLESVVPILEPKGHKHKILGSGVYIEFENRHYLATAGHVVQNNPKIFTKIAEDLIGGLNIRMFVGSIPVVDIVVGKLEEPLSMYQPIHIDTFKDFSAFPVGGTLVACGFPNSRTKVYGTVMDSELTCIFGEQESDETYKRVQADRTYSIVMKYQEKTVLNRSHNHARGPKLNGMSGGPLFWLPAKARYGEAVPQLVGILTNYDESTKSTIVATKVVWLKQFLP